MTKSSCVSTAIYSKVPYQGDNLWRQTSISCWQFIASIDGGDAGRCPRLENVEGTVMNTAALVLERLIEIGRAVGVKDAATVRSMVAETQDWVLEWQKQYVNSARVVNVPR
jgi:hypothetical protein